jgi:hypothetical protein
MFPKEYMDEFYKYEKNDVGVEFAASEDVKTAYFELITTFCPCVSIHWKNYLAMLREKSNATFDKQLTISDECYTIWFIKFNYEEEKKATEFIKEHYLKEYNFLKKTENAWTTSNNNVSK